MDGYTLNAARTIREYESSIQRPKAERTINDSILSALLRGDELPEMDVKAIRQYGIQCSEYLDFGYDVDASLSGMLSPHAVLEPRPNTPYVFRRAGFDNLPFIYTQRHLRNAIAPKEADNHQHGLTIEQIKALPEKLEEPVVVFDQPNYTVNGRSFEGKGVAAVLDMYDPDGVPVIAYFFPNGYGTKTNDNGCSNVIASERRTTSLHISRVLQTRKRSCISILRNMNKWKKSYPAMVGHDSLRRLQLFQWIL